MPQHPAPPESSRDDPAENSARGFAWAVPLMRAGYAGRGLVYLLVGGASLWSIWHGGSAEGTGEAMGRLQGALGTAILLLITLGMPPTPSGARWTAFGISKTTETAPRA